MTQLDPLERLLEDARAKPPQPSADLVARVQADALAALPAARRWSFLRDIGGWWGLGGVAIAGCAGFWIGMMPPEGLQTQVDSIWFSETTVWGEGLAQDGQGWLLEEEL